MKYLKEIVLFSFLTLTQLSFSQDYNYRNYSSEDGLAQSYVYSIIQDINGYLWIGTGNGLSRYNGFIFENFTTSDSLSDNFITCSIVDGEGLWFGHMNGRVSYFSGEKFRTGKLPLPDVSPITHFAKSPDGLVWASTYSDGLIRLSEDTALIKRFIFQEQVFITTFEFRDNNELIIGTNSGLLYCRIKETGEIEILRPVMEIPESKVTCIQKIRNKPAFYITTENDGVYKFYKDSSQFKVLKIFTDTDIDFSGIQSIYEDSQSGLWLSSFGNGIIKVNYSSAGELIKINYFNKATGFTADNVKTIYEDSEGNIWSGNYGDGLTQITPKTFSVFKFDKVLYGDNIFSIWSDNQYRWLGTENGLVKADQATGKILKFYGQGSGLPKDTVTAVYSDNGKELWIGTEKHGVYRFDTAKEEILKFPIGEGALENSVNIIKGKGEEVWIGTKKGLCNISSVTGKIKWYTINKGGLPHNFINCIYSDRSGKLWVSTHGNTLAYIKDEKVYKIPMTSTSGILTLSPITEDSESRIWVGSNGNGVFMIESDSAINLTVKEGLLSNYCYSLICDDVHNIIWVGHKGGLSKIRTTDFLVKPVPHIENVSDSYQFNPNAIIKDKQDKIWFGTDKGLVAYDPAMEYPRFMPPVLGITSFKINDEKINFTDKIILSPGNYKIRIDYLGISLKDPALVTYQYKLEGYDRWSEITKNTTITYNNLTEGRYTFILNSSSGDGAVSENPLTVSIFIKTPVWKKWWFYLIMVFVLISLIFIYIKRREYIFLAEKKILEEKVLERTREIQIQKDEIEVQRDIIDEKNTSITSSITYASHIQKAILPPIELINRLLPENFILSRPKDIVSGDFYWIAERDDSIVFTVADCTGHGVPGAFMSFLGITLLNSIVNIQGTTRSDEIVNKLRERVVHSLQQNRKDVPTSDGMDIALCVLDHGHNHIQYTGGMSNLVFIRDGKLEIIKANRFSVCIEIDNPGPFKLNEFDVRAGDVIYLFSDGYKDQFGGDFDKKYLVPHFYLTLLEIHKFPMSTQKELLENKLNVWMKGGTQTDDITVMGIRL